MEVPLFPVAAVTDLMTTNDTEGPRCPGGQKSHMEAPWSQQVITEMSVSWFLWEAQDKAIPPPFQLPDAASAPC